MRTTHTVDLYRPTTTKAANGAESKSYPASATTSGLAANVQARPGSYRAGRLTATPAGESTIGDFVVFLPVGTDVQPGDGLRVTAGVGPARLDAVFVDAKPGPFRTVVDAMESMQDFG